MEFDGEVAAAARLIPASLESEQASTRFPVHREVRRLGSISVLEDLVGRKPHLRQSVCFGRREKTARSRERCSEQPDDGEAKRPDRRSAGHAEEPCNDECKARRRWAGYGSPSLTAVPHPRLEPTSWRSSWSSSPREVVERHGPSRPSVEGQVQQRRYRTRRTHAPGAWNIVTPQAV